MPLLLGHELPDRGLVVADQLAGEVDRHLADGARERERRHVCLGGGGAEVVAAAEALELEDSGVVCG